MADCSHAEGFPGDGDIVDGRASGEDQKDQTKAEAYR